MFSPNSEDLITDFDLSYLLKDNEKTLNPSEY